MSATHELSPNEGTGRRRSRRLLVAIVAAGVLATLAIAVALRDTRPSTTAGGRSPTDWTEHRDDVRRFTIQHPPRWRVAGQPTTAHLTGTFELVTLATVNLPPGDGWCDPLPLRALEALGTDGALVHLRASLPGQADLVRDEGPLPARPASLQHASPPLERRPGCPPDDLDVQGWQIRFMEQGRVFDVLVAVGAGADPATVSEAWAVADSFRPAAEIEPNGDAEVDRPYLHTLYTHCGILGTRFNGTDWLADPPLSDGSGNPPPGWDGPFDVGTITLQPNGRTEFRSFDGASATFRLATDADPPLPICE